MLVTMGLLIVAIALLAASGVVSLPLAFRSLAGQRWAMVFMVAGSALGLLVIGRLLLRGDTASLDHAWLLPWGSFRLRADPLACFFLVPVFLIPALGSVYGLGYWSPLDHPGSARRLQFFQGLLAASMALVVLAESGVLFLIAWEVMALSAYFLATSDETDAAACKAGWMYLVGAHVSAVFLIAFFSLLHRSTGAFTLADIKPGLLPSGVATALLILGLLGFGFKIGLMPLHLFLPGAPAHAPSHVSALLSGVTYKVGIYGLIRIHGLLPVPPAWWGGLVLFAGSASAILGIAFALAQNSLKKALAYSSFENVGIISMGLGLALLGRSFGRGDWIALGLGGALFHSWNHAIFKPLFFFTAGTIERAVGTTEINTLGGLAKVLPRTATLFLLASAAICGLPPLNGFASELLIYLGLFRAAGLAEAGGPGSWPLATLAAPCLALAGTLAVACFVNLSGAIFLGQSRRAPSAKVPGDPPRSMLGPMIVLAALCAILGTAPGLVLPLIDHAVGAWTGTACSSSPPLSVLFPARGISVAVVAVSGLVGLA